MSLKIKYLTLAYFLISQAITSTAFAADIRLLLNDNEFNITTAVTKEERAQGLMYKKNMPANEGMLFYYSEPHEVSFWMKNTYIPLDILFFNQLGQLVNFHSNVQPCTNILVPCPMYSSDGPISYVLELNAGLANKMALKAGDTFTIIKE